MSWGCWRPPTTGVGSSQPRNETEPGHLSNWRYGQRTKKGSVRGQAVADPLLEDASRNLGKYLREDWGLKYCPNERRVGGEEHLSHVDDTQILGLWRVWCDTVSLSNVRSYTHNTSPTWLSQYELNENETRGLANWMGKSPRGSPSTEKSREWTVVFPTKGTPTACSVPHGQSWEHEYKSHCTDWAVIFRYTYIQLRMYMLRVHIATTTERRGHKSEVGFGKGAWKDLKRGKGREKRNYNRKNKKWTRKDETRRQQRPKAWQQAVRTEEAQIITIIVFSWFSEHLSWY